MKNTENIRIFLPGTIVILLMGGVLLLPGQLFGQIAAGKTLSELDNIRKQLDRELPRNVKIASFYLLNGTFVTGRVLTETSSIITVSEIKGAKIVVNTYGVRDIDRQTRSFRFITELDYDIELAESFWARTGDFQDDPDEFIQAVRFLEKALFLVKNHNFAQGQQAIRLIQHKIDAVKADRDIWVKEAKNRAALHQLELTAAFDKKMKDLDEINSKNQQQIADMKQKIQQLRADLAAIDRNVTWELDRLDRESYDSRRTANYMQYGPPVYPQGNAFYPPPYYPSYYYVYPSQTQNPQTTPRNTMQPRPRTNTNNTNNSSDNQQGNSGRQR